MVHTNPLDPFSLDLVLVGAIAIRLPPSGIRAGTLRAKEMAPDTRSQELKESIESVNKEQAHNHGQVLQQETGESSANKEKHKLQANATATQINLPCEGEATYHKESGKLKLASYYLDGVALYWHHNCMKGVGNERVTSGDYLEALCATFVGQKDPLKELMELRQVGNLETYIQGFDVLWIGLIIIMFGGIWPLFLV
uniref:Retrotransposon gag domain-containing protein n=1 Tax=Populus alba TaxID=43335 RepID=A0A4U5MHT2_POPAL|nr:hypothetical protein D5086_0000308800 [Populus alba]